MGQVAELGSATQSKRAWSITGYLIDLVPIQAGAYRDYARIVGLYVGSINLKRFAPLFAVAFLFSIAYLWKAARDRSAAPANDLAVSFIGMTNNPKSTTTVPRLGVTSDGRGLHALFSITNTSTSRWLQFGILRIEKRTGDHWKEHPSAQRSPALGYLWNPGHGCLYAIPWPSGLETNISWRLHLWVKLEPPELMQWANQRFHREFFPPYGYHTTTSSIVIPPGLAQE